MLLIIQFCAYLFSKAKSTFSYKASKQICVSCGLLKLCKVCKIWIHITYVKIPFMSFTNTMIPGKSQLLNVPQVPHLKQVSIRMTLGRFRWCSASRGIIQSLLMIMMVSWLLYWNKKHNEFIIKKHILY